VFTDSTDYPSFADLTGDFAYARLMRSEDGIASGYALSALDVWATRAHRWSHGDDNPDLPHVGDPRPSGPARDVFVFFISSAKHRNPAAAMALQSSVDAALQDRRAD
jgi:uncharacterized protein YecE (DUF72 family)